MKKDKLVLPVSVLLGCIILGSFLYASQLSKQKSIERQQQIEIEQDKTMLQLKAEQEKQDQLAKELKEQDVKEQAEQALNICIANAETNYFSQWYKECEAQNRLTNRCISLKGMSFSEYSDKNPPPVDLLQKGLYSPELKEFIIQQEIALYKEQAECSCRLPQDNADIINKQLQNDKDECFKKYPQK